MVEFNIQNLPPHILLEIFEFLSFDEMKSVSVVCHLWNWIISNSSEFLNKAVIKSSGMKQLNIKLTRKYRNFSFEYVKSAEVDSYKETTFWKGRWNQSSESGKFIKQIYLSQISEYGLFIRRLSFNGNSVESETFLNFIKSCNSLEELSLNSVQNISKTRKYNIVQLKKNFKVLEIIGSGWILDHLTIKNSYIKKMIISQCEILNYQDNRIHNINLINFLNRLEDVKLKFMSLELSELESQKDLNPKFEWETLRLENQYPGRASMFLFYSTEYFNWRQIISSSSNDASIELRCSDYGISSTSRLLKLMNFISENEKITSLDFGLFLSKKPQRILDNELNPFFSIKSLKVYDKVVENFKFPYYKFPYVENLYLSNQAAWDFKIRRINYLTEVKSLCMEVDMTSIPALELPSLENLEIRNFSSSNVRDLVNYKHVKNIKLIFSHYVIEKRIENLFKQLYEILPCTEKFEIIEIMKCISHKRSRLALDLD